MTCKDCIHFDRCKGLYRFERLQRAVSKGCPYSKDRSRFVDIAEVKRKIIRPLCNRCAALTDCQTCPACALEIREHCEHYKEAEQALKLKERENNAN